MKIPLDWLKEYVDWTMPTDVLAERLTMAGLEVEEIKQVAGYTVFDGKVTPNRGDWLSMIGVAREVAMLSGTKIKLPEPRIDGDDPSSAELIKISIKDPDLCGRYVGVVVRGVKIGQSPEWMQNRLLAAGMRPINNIVDTTNYVMLELGQPLHAFDLSLLNGSEIIVRRAAPGEKIKTLDESDRELDKDTLVIADSDRPVALAGVMGGFDSEIRECTQDILIESANFNSVSIRKTAKRLNMVTEASYRFERGVDPSVAVLAALRAAELIRDLAGGEVASGVVDVYPRAVAPLELLVRPERVNTMLGTDILPAEMADYLRQLEIEAEVRDGKLVCEIPTFRPDIAKEIDIVEEVGRVYGYDKLNNTLPGESVQGKDSPIGLFSERIRRILISCGAQEALTHSLVDDKLADIAGKTTECLRVRNPLSEEIDSMRIALVPNLLQVIARNQAVGISNLFVYEIGKVYSRHFQGDMIERPSVAGVMVGNLWGRSWNLPESALEVDFFTCKGAVEILLNGLGIKDARFEPVRDSILHPTRAAKILVGERELGILGEIAPKAAESLDVKGDAYAFELDVNTLMQCAPGIITIKDIPRFPAMYRHMAVVVSDSLPYADVESVIRATGKEMVESIDLLDIYKSDLIGAEKRSLTIAMSFRSTERTLTDEEVNDVLSKIKESLTNKVGASFR